MKHSGMRRIFAGILCVLLFLTSMPIDALAEEITENTRRQTSMPVMLAELGAVPVETALEYFNSRSDTLVALDVTAITADEGNVKNTELIGKPFKYKVQLTFASKEAEIWEYKDNNVTVPLIDKYENVTAWVKAPAGIMLIDDSGNPLSLDADGYYKMTFADVYPSSKMTVSVSSEISAIMTGNGSTPSKDYAAAQAKFRATVKLPTTYGEPDEEWEQREGTGEIGTVETPNAASINTSATHGIGEAKWAVVKTEEGNPTVLEDGKIVRMDYLIAAGRNVGTDEQPVIADTADNYARYGTLDLNDDAYIVDIAPIVNDKNGNPVEPSKITVQVEGKDSAMREVSLDANNSYTIPASDFSTVSGEGCGIEGSVKAKTVVHVSAYYPTENFTYSVVDGKDRDEDAFSFTNTAKLSYSLKGVGTTVTDTDDATVRWCGIAAGGNIQVSEYIFPGTGSKAAAYNNIYRKQLGAPSYTVTRCDKDGNALPGDSWSMQLTFDADNTTNTIVTGDPAALTDDGKFVIPTGYVKVTANYSGIAGIGNGDINAVDKDGNVIHVYSSAPIEIKENETAGVDFFLKYIDGGFLSFQKQYYDADGQQITDAEEIADLAESTSFTLTKLDEPSKGRVYSFTLNADASWTELVKAGSYSVTETAPSGYHPANVNTVTVASGEMVNVNNGAIANYRSKAIVKAAPFSTDMFAEGKLQGTLDTAEAFADDNLKYEVYAADEKVGELTTGNSFSCEVERYDGNGNLIEYTIVEASGALPKALYGSVDGTTMTEGVTSAPFRFESNTDLTHTVNWYYRNTMKVKVVKTVVDPRDNTHNFNANGWKFELKQGDAPVESGYTAKVGSTNGVLEFSMALPLTDENGNYCTYSVTELGYGDEPLDDELFAVTYSPESVKASHANKDQTVQFSVNNAAQVGYLKLTLQDYEKSSNKLNNARFVIYYLDGETPMYVMDKPLNEDGLRKVSPDIADALVCVTGKDGTGYFNLDFLSCAVTYYAQEIEAPAGYMLESAPVKIGNLNPYDTTSSSTKSKTTTNVTVKNVKLPQLTITKTSIDENGKNKAVSTVGQVKFQVYVRNPENHDKIVKLTNADGSNFVVQVDIVPGSVSGSEVVTLPGAGYYYLKEIESTFNLILPENGAAQGQTFVEKYEGDTLVEYLIEVPQVKDYTGTASNKKQHKVKVTAKDVNNEAKLKITKYDYTFGGIIAAYDGRYCIAAYVPCDDTALKMDLIGRDWQASAATADLPTIPGYDIYVSPTVATVSGEYETAILGRDSSGRAITYKVVELQAPLHYYNKGTSYDEHNVAEATHDNACTLYEAKLYDIKAIEVDLTAYLQKMYELDTNSSVLGSDVAPFEFSIYEVNGDRLTLKATTTVSGSTAKFTLDKVHLDTTKEHYIVETDSCGFDTRMGSDIAGRTDGRLKIDPSAITKVSDITGTFDAGAPYGTVKLNSFKIGAAEWANYKQRDDENGTYYIESADFMNYEPYFQIVLHSSGAMPTGIPEEPWHITTDNVDKFKFKMYKIPAKDYSGDPQAAVSSGAAKTDDYIYDTGTYFGNCPADPTGEFITEWLDYSADYVYIFKELTYLENMPNGFKAIPEYVYTVITPEMYKGAKNGIYKTNRVLNEEVKEEDYGYECYVQIKLDKFIDKDISLDYDRDVDEPLAGVLFDAQLIDKDGKIVDCEELTTRFTTGVDSSDPSSGISASMHVTPDVFNGLTARGYDVENIFSFKCEGEPRKYRDFAAEVNTPIDVDVEGSPKRGSLYTISFNMRLTEKSYHGVPLTNVAADIMPIQKSYVISFTDVPNGATWQNKDHIEENDPILNIEGKGVLMRPAKLDADGNAWVPADANDKVVLKIYAADFDDSAWNDSDYAAFKEYEITLNEKNYNNPPIIQLKPETDYIINEVYSPKMYDKPNGDVDSECSGGAYKTFQSFALTSRIETGEEDRVQTVSMRDPAYQTITVKKLDSQGNPVAGKKMRIEYTAALGDLSATIICDANNCWITPTDEYVTNLDDGRTVETDFVGVTDANGVVSFTVPVYDNRAMTSVSAGEKTSTLCTTLATYRVQELDDSYVPVATFNVLNEQTSASGIVNVQADVNTVVNPETGKLIISMFGVTEDDTKVAPIPVEGVRFDVSYAPFTESAQVTAAPTASDVSAIESWTELGSRNTDGNGLVTLTERSSGFYKIVETVPNHYVDAGKTNTIYIAYVTPADRLSLAEINKTAAYGSLLVIETETEKATRTVDGKTYTVFEADTAADEPTLKVRSIRKGYLDIAKIFAENGVGIAAPASVKVGVRDASGQKVGDEQTITITNGAGAIAAYYELDPGTYTVYECATGTWHGKGAVAGDANASNAALTETERECSLANVAVKPSDTASNPAQKTEGDNPAQVCFMNVNATMHLSGVKVSSDEQFVPNAKFVVLNNADGTYYKGTVGEDGYGEWTSSLDEAKNYITDNNGVLSIDFVAAKSVVEAMTDIAADKTAYTFREVEVEGADYMSLIDFTHDFALGESYTAAKEELLDRLGYKLEFTLYGRTLENITAGGDKPTVDGASFTLYKVGADGKTSTVSTVDKNLQQAYRSVTSEGKGYYSFLDPLEEGESYFLVQNGPTEGFWNLYSDAESNTYGYISAEMGAGAMTIETVDGKHGFTVISYGDELPQDRTYRVNLYNEPMSRLLILKYNDLDSKTEDTSKIPVGARFVITPVGNGIGRKESVKTVSLTEAPTEKTIELAKALGIEFDGFFTDDLANYSFAEIDGGIAPGKYVISESVTAEDKDYAANWLFTPNAKESDPWYPVRTVEIDDDGGLTVVRFSNIPTLGNQSFDKKVIAVNGETDGKPGNAQYGFQTIKFEISNFAPCAGEEGAASAYVPYPVKSLSLTDNGLSFSSASNPSQPEPESVVNVESYVVDVTVGKAYYDTEGTVCADVYGISGGIKTLVEGGIALTEAQTIPFPTRTYDSFEVDYYDSTIGSGLKQHFKAEAVQATMEYMQKKDDPTEAVIANVNNLAFVRMSYDVGETSPVEMTARAEINVSADDMAQLPTASLTEIVSVLQADGTWNTPLEGIESINIMPGDVIRYVLVFKNTTDVNDIPEDKSAEDFAIPMPFIADEMPECIDIGATVNGAAVSVNVTTDDMALKPYLGSVVTESDKVISVKRDGIEYKVHPVYVLTDEGGKLMPGKSVTLTVYGTANDAKIMEKLGQSIVNVGFGGSTDNESAPKNKLNPGGAPFHDSEHAAPGSFPGIEAVASCAALTDSVTHTVQYESGVMIVQAVAGEQTGLSDWKSGDSDTAVTYANGRILYKISFASTTSVPAGQLRVADILPVNNKNADKSIGGASRRSAMKALGLYNFKVFKNGAQLSDNNYTLHTSDNSNQSYYKGVLETDKNTSIPNSKVSGDAVRGFVLQIDEDVIGIGANGTESETGDVYTVTFECKAPAGVEHSAAGYAYNYAKIAVNDAVAWRPMGSEGNAIEVSSNRCRVTILPEETAEIGDRVWLDKNANGIQDSGEPDFSAANGFPTVGGIALRTFKNSNAVSGTGEAQSLAAGRYSFGSLLTEVVNPDMTLYSNGHAMQNALNGDIRTLYQLVIRKAAIPDGYMVTIPYAANNGAPTVLGYAIAPENSTDIIPGMQYYVPNDDDGHDTDSDFVLVGDEYVTRRFYLPYGKVDMEDMGYNELPNVSYMNFDLGLVRCRNLEITVSGANGETDIEGATFVIYGPYETEAEAKAGYKTEGVTPFAAITSAVDSTGKVAASFVSTPESLINYYRYYVVVEKTSGREYLNENIIDFSGDSDHFTQLDEKTMLLKPGTDDENTVLESIGITDEYVASGKMSVTGSKSLIDAEGADHIAEKPFNDGMFSFKLKSVRMEAEEGSGINYAFDENFESGVDFLNADGAIELSASYVHVLPESKTEVVYPATYVYELSENDIDSDEEADIEGIRKDTAVYTITNLVTDDGAGKLDVVTTITDANGSVVDTAAFVNSYNKNNLSFSKTVSGTPKAENDEFVFTVTVTPEADNKVMEKVLAEHAFTLMITGDADTTVTFGDDLTAAVTLRNGETATIVGLPKNSGYTITETDYSVDGYATEVDGTAGNTATGTIGDTAVEHAFVNTREAGSLRITKELAGSAAKLGKEFELTVALSRTDNVNLAGAYATAEGGTVTFDDNDGAATAAIRLTPSDVGTAGAASVTILNIPADTAYTVAETVDHADIGFVKGEIVTDGKTIVKDATVTASVVNSRNVGSLKLGKIVTLSSDATVERSEFTFDVLLSYPKTMYPALDLTNTAGMPVAVIADGKSDTVSDPTIGSTEDAWELTYTVKLNATAENPAEITLNNILEGASYTITEDDYVSDGLNRVEINDVVSPTRVATGTIGTDTVEVCYNNIRTDGSISISKALDGNAADANKAFEFIVILTAPEGSSLSTSYAYEKGSETGRLPVTDGKLTFSIKGGETMTIKGILDGTLYSVTEKNYNSDGYLQTKIVNDGGAEQTLDNRIEPADYITPVTGTITVDADETKTVYAVAYTNVRNAGKLKVAKTVSGNGSETDFEEDRKFTFEITLTGPKGVSMEGTYALAEGSAQDSVTFDGKTEADGKQTVKATVELSGGQYVEITDIPTGTEFNVTESDCRNIGYVTTWTGLDGDKTKTIVSDTTSEVTATNERHVGELDLTKAFEGTGKELAYNYSFKVVFTYNSDIDLTKETNLPYLKGASGTVNAQMHTVTFSAVSVSSDGTPVVFTNILSGTAYSVTEKNYNSDGYLQTKIVNDGGAEQTLDNRIEPADYLTPVTGTITVDADETKTVYAVAYTNVRNAGKLKVAKTVSGNGSETDFEEDRKFAFEITLTGPKGVNMEGTYALAEGSAQKSVTFDGKTGADGKQTVKATVELSGGQYVEITDIPAGTEFNVTESDCRNIGYVTTWTGLDDDKTIVSDATSEVTATNERHVGELDLTKAFEGTGKELTANYSFMVVFTYNSDIDLTKATNLPYLKGASGTVNAQMHTVTFSDVTVSSDGTPVVFTNILSGTAYSVTEKNYNSDGYLQTKIVNDGEAEQTLDNRTEPADYLTPVTGTIAVDADETKTVYVVAYTNVRNAGDLKVSKVLEGEALTDDTEKARPFGFTVTLTGPEGIDMSGSYDCVLGGAEQTISFTAVGSKSNVVKATFELKHGEEMWIKDIPTDSDAAKQTNYTVVENDYGYLDYKTLYDGEPVEAATGSIVSGVAAEHKVTNIRHTAGLTITKAFESFTDANDLRAKDGFTFRIVLTYDEDIDLSVEENLPLCEVNGRKAVGTRSGNKITIEAKINTDETLYVTNVLVGVADTETTYTIEEIDEFEADETYMSELGYLVPKYTLAVDGIAGEAVQSNLVSEGRFDAENPEKTFAYTFTNSREVGALKLTKNFEGNATSTDDSFVLTVTLNSPVGLKVDRTYDTIDQDGAFGTVTFIDGKAAVELTGGESLTILDISAGTEYTVKEADYIADGYYVTFESGASGIVGGEVDEEGKPVTTDYEITNDRDLGYLVITKALDGNAPETTRAFSFSLTLCPGKTGIEGYDETCLPVAPAFVVNPDADTFTLTTGEQGDGTVTLNKGEDGTATLNFTLRGGQSLRLNDIYAGTTYAVTEEDCTLEGYTTVKTNESGIIPTNAALAPMENGITATFTNTRNVGKLTVSKTVVAVGTGIPTDRVFTFTINLKRPNGTNYTGELHTEDGRTVTFINGRANVTLKHGESLTLNDILTGSAYSVSEADYKDCVTTSVGASGTIDTGNSTAAFTNVIRQITTEMTIVKVWDDDADADNPRVSNANVRVSNQFGVIGTYELNEANGWTVTLTDMPKYTEDGELVKYSVTEIDVPDGYKVYYSTNGNTITVRNRRKNGGVGEGSITVNDLNIPLSGSMNASEGYCFN